MICTYIYICLVYIYVYDIHIYIYMIYDRCLSKMEGSKSSKGSSPIDLAGL